MKNVLLTAFVGTMSMMASAEEWDLAWKKIEPYTGRSAVATKTATAATSVDGRTTTWCESALGALDTLGLGFLLFLR